MSWLLIATGLIGAFMLALGCGLAMVAISYFVSSAVLMSLACVGIIVAMYLLKRQGWD